MQRSAQPLGHRRHRRRAPHPRTARSHDQPPRELPLRARGAMRRREPGQLRGGHFGCRQRGRGAPASPRQPQLIEGTREAVARLPSAECGVRSAECGAHSGTGCGRLGLQAGCRRVAGWMPQGCRLDATGLQAGCDKVACLRLHGRLEQMWGDTGRYGGSCACGCTRCSKRAPSVASFSAVISGRSSEIALEAFDGSSHGRCCWPGSSDGEPGCGVMAPGRPEDEEGAWWWWAGGGWLGLRLMR